MIYPYTHKFLLYADIVECITGVVRMIEFRCFNQSGISEDTDLSLGSPDPTIEGAHRINLVMSLIEGDFKKGRPNGFCRRIDAFNGYCQMGYFSEGKVLGKYAEHNLLTDEKMNEPGLYFTKKECLAKMPPKDFLVNELPPNMPMNKNDIKRQMEIAYFNDRDYSI